MKRKMTEDQIIMEGIHRNFLKHRELNARREKERKRKAIVSNILCSVGSVAFLFGVMYFISIVESMSF